MPFRFSRLEIPGLVLVESTAFEDRRGFLKEGYRFSTFTSGGVTATFVQDNLSRSRHGVIRGLHYQRPPRAQSKLVGVIRGEIFDVAVDIREGSPTYGRWTSVVLSDRNHQMFFIPAGFAHGFCVLSDEADVWYKVDAEHAPELEGGIIWNDPDLGIEWPVADPVLSTRDVSLPRLRDATHGFQYGQAGS